MTHSGNIIRRSIINQCKEEYDNIVTTMQSSKMMTSLSWSPSKKMGWPDDYDELCKDVMLTLLFNCRDLIQAEIDKFSGDNNE